jgi:diguanylate cyclase (GGDEF)-like protein
MKALIVEDDTITRLVLGRLLTDRGYEVTACASAEKAIEAYGLAFYPLLFLDLFLPGMDGFTFCQWVRNQPGGKRHLILVGTASDRKGDLEKILDAGADDYITKPYDADTLDIRLIIAQARVKNIELRTTLESNLNQERELLQYLATHDPLTKLLNRTALMEVIQVAVQTGRPGNQSALIYLDLDNFKIINDSRGHATGDKVLCDVAAILQTSVRANDVSSRIGGDEFAILLRNISLHEAKALAERILSRMKEFAFSESKKTFHIEASMGIAMIDGTVECEGLLAFADSACYAAKIHGNRVEAYDRNDESMAELLRQGPRVAEIMEAISGQRIDIVFQPIVNIRTLEPFFYEVLARMNSDGKLLLPRSFLPTAERFHLLPEIDRQVIGKTVPYLAAIDDLHLAINLSGQSFADEALPDFIESSFKAADIDHSRVIFEITETAVISNLRAARTMMHRLRATGFRFSLDDFGVGFSSFNYLKELVPDYLKIDGSFIPQAKTDQKQWIFVEMMNDIAHRLKIESIAECVEDELTLTNIRRIGVDLGQGFLFGRPQSTVDESPSHGRINLNLDTAASTPVQFTI